MSAFPEMEQSGVLRSCEIARSRSALNCSFLARTEIFSFSMIFFLFSMASAHSLITESKILYSKESNVYSSTGIAITPYTLSSIQMARYRHCASLKRSVVAPARCLFSYTHFAISCSLLVNKSSVCSFFLFENIYGDDNSSSSTTYATILRSNNLISCVHVILKISVSFFAF